MNYDTFSIQITDEHSKIIFESDCIPHQDFSVFESSVDVTADFLHDSEYQKNKPLCLSVEYGESKLLADIAVDDNGCLFVSIWEDSYSDDILNELGEIYSARTDRDIFVYAEYLIEDGVFIESITQKQLDENKQSFDFPLGSPLYRVEADFYSRGEHDFEVVYNFEKEEPFEDVLTKIFSIFESEQEYESMIDFYLEVHAVPVGPGSVERRYVDDMVIMEYSASFDTETGDMEIDKTSDETPPYINYITHGFYNPSKGIYYSEPVHIFS